MILSKDSIDQHLERTLEWLEVRCLRGSLVSLSLPLSHRISPHCELRLPHNIVASLSKRRGNRAPPSRGGRNVTECVTIFNLHTFTLLYNYKTCMNTG